MPLRPRTLARVLVMVATVGSAVPALGQGYVTLAAGSTSVSQVQPAVGVVVPLVVDLARAGGGEVSSVSGTLDWDATTLRLDSLTGAGVGAIVSDLASASVGIASFAFTGPASATSFTAGRLFFTALRGSGGARVRIAPTIARNSVGIIGLGQVVPRYHNVCIMAPGLWGDGNDDGAVDILDAQQIARHLIGLSVTSPASIARLGDVNADGVVDIIDAQQIARYSVGLPAAARTALAIGAPPAPASLVPAMASSAMTLTARAVYDAIVRDSSGASMVGCRAPIWTTNDSTIVMVNETGAARALRAGTATLTATLGGLSTQTVVTVTTPDTTSTMLLLRTFTAGGPANTNTFDGIWLQGGLLTDEWKSSDTFAERNAEDQRAVSDADLLVATDLRKMFAARSDARYTIATATAAPSIAQMYFVMGYVEMLLAENFCNGIVLDTRAGGLTVSGPPQSNATLYAMAIAHYDSALASATGGDALSTTVKNLASIGKARTLINTGQSATAAGMVANVPTAFSFLGTLGAGETNRIFALTNTARRYAVGDSLDPAGVIGNALPFASAADPRVIVNGRSTGTSPAGKGFDGVTNAVLERIWTTASTAIPLLSGLDARLIEAEARLNANDLPGMMTILNALRAAPPSLGGYTPPAMAALATPVSTAAGVDLLFRERAFWTFGRGQRLGDLRRLVRVYGRAVGSSFPTGTFFKGGAYGSAVNLPANVDEQGNSLTTVCSDRTP